MSRNVKKRARRRSAVSGSFTYMSPASGRSVQGPVEPASPPVARTRISSKHQVTIARQAFDAAGFQAGDVVAVRALGPGRVELTRLDELFAKHRGRVKGDSSAREAIDQMRDEWL